MKDTKITSSTHAALGHQVPLICCDMHWMPAVEMLTAMPGDLLRTLEASRRAAKMQQPASTDEACGRKSLLLCEWKDDWWPIHTDGQDC